MELELRLHPDDAPRLTRVSVVRQALQGRPRNQARRLIWHDDAQRSLAAQGLVLAEEREGWSLTPLVPGVTLWLPGAPPPVVERAPDAAGFEHALPSPTAPVASFQGRLAVHTLAAEPEPVTLGLLRGSLRAVTAEQPACRVLLSGPENAVRDVALALAQELRLAVPAASLAGEGFAVAHGVPPPARHHGAPELPPDDTVAEAFAYVIGHLTDVILHFAAAAADPRSDPEPIHQMRVGVRRLRSCFAVFRPAVDCEVVQRADRDLKMLGKKLAPARDWDVFMTETAPALLAAVPDDPRLVRLLRAAGRKRQEHHAALGAYLASPEFRALGIELAWLASARSWHEELDEASQQAMQMPLSAFAADSVQRRMNKLLGAAEEIETLDPAGLHGVRLRGKRLRYAAEIFATLYTGKAARRFIHRLSRLQQHLGEANDATVAGALMQELGGPGGRHGYAVGVIQGFAAARSGDTRARIMRSWDKFRHQAPFWS